ncbi:MAG: YezD family protein [Methylococcaceae bacterium]|nr:YezD family protein [Methylococcaceae bacterium]
MALESGKYGQEQQLEHIAKQIAAALQGIRFGSVEITIHDSKVVQVERKEKLRFDNKSTSQI